MDTKIEREQFKAKCRRVYESAIKQSGKKQYEVAKMLGINESKFSMIVNGHVNPTIKQAESIRVFFEILNNDTLHA